MANVPRLHPVHLAALVALTAAGACAPSANSPAGRSDPPQRIVSLNLCTDQLLLTLADREQIAGLSVNATDAEMSAEAARARGLPVLDISAEHVLEIDPDLIVGSPARGNPMAAALSSTDRRLLDIETANSLDQIFASIRTVSAAVGHPDRGEATIARMKRDLARIPRNGGGKVAAYYQRRGYLTGAGTLIDDMMRHLGLVNLAAKLGKPPLSQVSLEEMVAARPDFIIVESATDTVSDQGTEMLHHPALADIPRIGLPQAWAVCGSPAYVAAVRTMAEQIAAHR